MHLLENNSQHDTEKNNQPFSGIPGNIKQMGSVEPDLRIYMEDYVHTYLYRFAKGGASKEKLAILVGKTIKVDGEDVLIINGALQGKFTQTEKGVEVFTDKSWEVLQEEREKFFKESEIVGWAHTQPGYGAFLMVRDEAYHKENFPKSYQVLYVLDPMEKTDAFFIHENYGGIKKAKGYFIYYDKNENMQNYMEENPVIMPKENKFDVEDEDGAPFLFGRPDAAKKIREILRLKEKKPKQPSKYNAALGVGAAFLAIVLIIGAGLIRNNDKITQLENQINLMSAGSSSQTVLASADSPLIYEEISQVQLEEISPTDTETPENTENPQNSEDVSTSYAEQAYSDNLPEDEILCYYNVKKGDSLMYISRKYFGNTSMVDRIAEVNNIQSPDMIYYGKRIAIPKN